MRDQLLAYLLNDLDDKECRAVEEALAADPQLQAELDHLRECLQLSQQDCESDAEDAPPCELANRTCSLVKAVMQRSQRFCRSSASLSESRDELVSDKRWKLPDLVVAVCVLVALGALVLPALRESREAARRNQCQANLEYLGESLSSFNEHHDGHLPVVHQGENAGIFVLTLVESGSLNREVVPQLVVCPGTPLAERVARGCIRIPVPTREEYNQARGACFLQIRKLMSGDYAYNLGYRDSQGRLQQICFTHSPRIPLLSDKPSREVAGYRSANHGGCGQNVIFQDLSCRYCTICEQIDSGDHWFLNNEGQQAAGCDSHDVVLGPSEATPLLVPIGYQLTGPKRSH